MPPKDRHRQRQHIKTHYYNNRQYYIDKASRKKKAVTDFMKKYKEEHPCTDCGVSYPHYVMDFDHLDGFEKEGLVSRIARKGGITSLMREIEKCEVVCSNCHRIRTHLRQDEHPSQRRVHLSDQMSFEF